MTRNLFLLVAAAALSCVVSCGGNHNDYDASGTFEAEEVTVSSEADGRIIELNVTEGSLLYAGQEYGLIDTVQLYLQKCRIEAGIQAALTKKVDVTVQTASLSQRIEVNKKERKRVKNLIDAKSANQKQLDDLNSSISILESEYEATVASLNQTNAAIDAEVLSLKTQIEQVNERLARCRVTSPITGTVLVRYAKAGELTGAGRPLFKVADVSNMTLRAYISASQLADVKLGQPVTIYADDSGKGLREYQGRVSWISDAAEFTPKTIKNRDERVNLVYAVKISFVNDGYVKIGMYGDVEFR